MSTMDTLDMHIPLIPGWVHETRCSPAEYEQVMASISSPWTTSVAARDGDDVIIRWYSTLGPAQDRAATEAMIIEYLQQHKQ